MEVMKFIIRMIRRAVLLFAFCAVVLLSSNMRAATQYFDTNGTTAGSGITNGGSYSWEDPNWNVAGTNDANAANGVSTTGAWVDGNFPRFAAGTDANGFSYTVNVGAPHTIAGMQLLIGAAFTGGPNVNGGATVNINATGAGTLVSAPALQGLFVSTNGNLKINAPISGTDATSALQWSGGGGSAYLYGANTFQGGIKLNTANGLNFNNSQSFGTGPITYTTINTAVLANPDTTGPVTINNALTMPDQTTANKTMIYTGHDPVTFTSWTLGNSPAGITPMIGNVLTVGNTPFPAAKLIVNNLAGTANSNLTVGSPTGVSGTLVLTGTSTYGGAANGGVTTLGQVAGTAATPAAPSAGIPVLQADDGTGLPTNSLLQLNGGVLQTSGTFNRPLVAAFGHNVVWGWPSNDAVVATQTSPGGGGFSAIGSQLTVNINGDNSELAWGESAGDVGSRILGPLKFGSGSSNAKTLWVNPVDLAGLGTPSLSRTIIVSGGAGGDSTEMSGVIRNTGLDIDLTKNGTGTLILSAANTYGGTTTVTAGKLLANNTSGSATGTSAITIASGATLGGTGTVSGAVVNNGIIAPGASVGTLSVGGGLTDGANSSWSIELSGALADKLAVTGNIDLSAADALNVTGTGTGSSWIIGTYTGALTGTFDTVTPGYSVTYTGGNITLNAAPVGLAGDFNSDGKVDAGDYATWRKNETANLPLANDNGVGNQAARFSLWRANFGKPPGAGSTGGLGTNGGAVPEPSSIALCMLGLVALATTRRERE
jgi:autotransporter-associated beta strand protein